MRKTGYRLRMRPLRRWATVAFLVLMICFFGTGVVSGFDFWWSALSAAGLVMSALGIRSILGPVVVVRPSGVRIQRNWPLRRDVAWHRMLIIDVIPGFWNLEIELNSGERLTLPCVDDIEDLYNRMERFRTAIDAA
jgi:hypothetical protein